MMQRNSTLQRKTPLRAKAPMARTREKKGPGLAQLVAQIAGTDIKHLHCESSLLRSEQHRKNVAALPCTKCGILGFSQAAHVNYGKGGALKTCDSLTFPLCCDRPGIRGCHSLHDQGGIYTKQERILKEWEHVDKARATLIRKNQWSPEIEVHYQRAIEPLRRVVHTED